jgi:hypothetical protein
MKPTRDLRRLQRSAESRLERVRTIAHDAVGQSLRLDADIRVTYCVMETYNCWYAFSRSLFLSSSLGAYDGTGKRVSVTVQRPKTIDDALEHSIRANKPNVLKHNKAPFTWPNEPSWAQADVLLRSLNQVGASNYSVVQLGVGVGPQTLKNLVVFRHFFAHRGQGTLQRTHAALRSAGISAHLHPADALCAHAMVAGTPSAQPLLLDWIDDVYASVGLAI